MEPQADPLRQIAESLRNLERLYAEETHRQEEQRKEMAERLKKSDVRQEQFEERQKVWDKNLAFKKPWLHPAQLANLLMMLALLLLAIAIFYLARR
jgi:hypothetical protein